MQERGGIRIGQKVRDLDGTRLGRVTALYDGAFAVRGGIPILFRRDHVVRDDEVRGVRDGELVVARSRRDVFDLAAGAVPPAWRVRAPPDFPSTATPAEARLLLHDLARGAIVPDPGVARALETGHDAAAGADEEREYARASGEPVAAPPR